MIKYYVESSFANAIIFAFFVLIILFSWLPKLFLNLVLYVGDTT